MTPGYRMLQAIRAFTFDKTDHKGHPIPNGKTEVYSEMLLSMADDVQRLREAAEGYFVGSDFKRTPP